MLTALCLDRRPIQPYSGTCCGRKTTMVAFGTMTKESMIAEFGREVRRRRKEMGLTLEKLAEQAELTVNYLGTIERGRRDPSLSTVASIAHGLGIPAGALIGKTPVMGPKAHEMAALFDQAPLEIQAGLLMLLRVAAVPAQPKA